MHRSRDKLASREACSFDGTMHYTFDYAQQVHIPSNPMQPGPIYFKTPRKCGIFGVSCEAVPRQINYSIDEAGAVGKGANATISYVHHFFAQHGLGEKHVHLHADNCSGQNKNNYFPWYFAWRIATKLHQSVSSVLVNSCMSTTGTQGTAGEVSVAKSSICGRFAVLLARHMSSCCCCSASNRV